MDCDRFQVVTRPMNENMFSSCELDVIKLGNPPVDASHYLKGDGTRLIHRIRAD
jgi:hypothetical protein